MNTTLKLFMICDLSGLQGLYHDYNRGNLKVDKSFSYLGSFLY